MGYVIIFKFLCYIYILLSCDKNVFFMFYFGFWLGYKMIVKYFFIIDYFK